jgi:hypothetical protein
MTPPLTNGSITASILFLSVWARIRYRQTHGFVLSSSSMTVNFSNPNFRAIALIKPLQ